MYYFKNSLTAAANFPLLVYVYVYVYDICLFICMYICWMARVLGGTPRSPMLAYPNIKWQLCMYIYVGAVQKVRHASGEGRVYESVSDSL